MSHPSHTLPGAQGLPNEQYRFVRRTIIGIVLATDMVEHSRLTKVDHSHLPGALAVPIHVIWSCLTTLLRLGETLLSEVSRQLP